MICNILKFFTAYNLLDNGVSNILGLQTLRHGTNFYNFWKIQLEGAQPACGGTGIGSERGNRCRGEFYVWKDKIDIAWVNQGYMYKNSEGEIFNDWSKERRRYNDWSKERRRYNGESKPYPLTARQIFWFQRRQSLSARRYAVNATFALFERLPFFRSSVLFNESRDLREAALTERAKVLSMLIVSVMIGNLIPQVKFHFTDQQIENNVKTGRFRDDPLNIAFPPSPDYLMDPQPVFFTAFVTDKVIENSHLGVSGSLRQGLNANLPENMKNHPYKVLYGSLCLIGSGLFCRSLYRNATSQSRSCALPVSLEARAVRVFKRGSFLLGMLLYNAYS